MNLSHVAAASLLTCCFASFTTSLSFHALFVVAVVASQSVESFEDLGMRALLLIIAAMCAGLAAAGPAGPPPNPCSLHPNIQCLEGGVGAACVTYFRNEVLCGTCVADTANSCTYLECSSAGVAQGCDALSASNEPTCDTATMGTGPGATIATPCGTDTIFATPDELAWPRTVDSSDGTLNLTLRVRLATFNATAFTFRARQYCVDGVGCEGTIAPLLRFLPGDTIRVTVINDLVMDCKMNTNRLIQMVSIT